MQFPKLMVVRPGQEPPGKGWGRARFEADLCFLLTGLPPMLTISAASLHVTCYFKLPYRVLAPPWLLLSSTELVNLDQLPLSTELNSPRQGTVTLASRPHIGTFSSCMSRHSSATLEFTTTAQAFFIISSSCANPLLYVPTTHTFLLVLHGQCAASAFLCIEMARSLDPNPGVCNFSGRRGSLWWVIH